MDAIFIIQQTILFTIPLMIVGLGGVFSERSGIINLALDGEMVIGAFAGAIVAKLVIASNPALANAQWLFLVCLLISAAAGALFSLLLSFAAINLKADQTIEGTALNMIAPAIVCMIGLLSFNSERIFSGANFVILKSSYSPSFQQAFDGPMGWFFDLFFNNIYISTYIIVILYVLLSVWLYKSKIGTHVRACGEHPQAAASVGINVYRMRYLGTTISGALAGIGGFAYITTCAATTAESSVGGLGFLALAIMIFGNWNPLFIALGAVFFGFLKCLGVLSSQISWISAANLPSYFYNIIPYAVVILVLILTRSKSGCPKAEGIPYEKGER